MPIYKVSGPRPVHGTAPGEQLDEPLDDVEEGELVAAGRILIEPSSYRVVGPNVVHGTKPGATFDRALTAGQERQLVEGGHIELVSFEPDELAELKRPELDERAAEMGVEEPAKLPNKGSVIDAIREESTTQGEKEE